MDTEGLIAGLAAKGPGKPLPSPLAMTGKWLLALLLYFIVVTAFTGLRPDMAVKWQQPLYRMELAGILVTAVTAAFAASFLALPDVGQRPWIRFLPFLPLMFLAGLLWQSVAAGHAMPLIECIRAERYDCIALLALFSIVPGVFMFVTIQRAAPTRCCWAGSMAGLAVASVGYILLRLVDTSDDPSMLILWHFIPVMLITMAGMVIGKFYFRHSALSA